MTEDLKSIVAKFKDYNFQHKYLFFEQNNDILDLENFRCDLEEKKIPRIIAIFNEGKYSGKKAFVIDKNNIYDIYYNNQKFMRIEPNKFNFGHSNINGEHYLCLTFNHQQLDKIPDNFRCEFIKKNSLNNETTRNIEKTTYCFKEYFNITEIGTYSIFKDEKIFRKITTYVHWDFDINEEEEDLFVSYD
ncbi:6825_t:CDS:1 [Scutellospora calospora]|uniref:6825_t:CDS:1 n=1 Tax=Scutellospora calospora TaxID=85575 RepID=A0ACA9MHS6_9GLOM|nr:6825_t:CDS:1 [Scutellospora calospora]